MYGYNPGYPQYGQMPYQPAPQYSQASVPQMQAPRMPLTGRAVSSPDEITVQEVPTDGSMGWFPSQDGSCVWGKKWTPDGNIMTMRFVPELTDQQTHNQDPFAAINARMDEMFDLIEDISDNMPRQQTRRTARKPKAGETDAE